MPLTSDISFKISFVLGLLALSSLPAAATDAVLFQRTMPVSLQNPVVLDVAVARGDLTVSYNRDGQVTVYAYAKQANEKYIPRDRVEASLNISQKDNQITIRSLADSPDLAKAELAYRVDVPTRTQLNAVITGNGNLVVVGISGPATVKSGSGDVEAQLIRPGPLKASTGRGRISCTRVYQLDVEASSGDITLLEDGPSVAKITHGIGTIEIGGAKGTVDAATDKGSIHIKAVNWEDWKLASASGDLRIEVPPDAKFKADLATDAGDIEVWRSGVQAPAESAHVFKQDVNGGGRCIWARSQRGNISVQ